MNASTFRQTLQTSRNYWVLCQKFTKFKYTKYPNLHVNVPHVRFQNPLDTLYPKTLTGPLHSQCPHNRFAKYRSRNSLAGGCLAYKNGSLVSEASKPHAGAALASVWGPGSETSYGCPGGSSRHQSGFSILIAQRVEFIDTLTSCQTLRQNEASMSIFLRV